MKFRPQIVLKEVILSYNRYLQTRIYTTTGRTRNLYFWSNFDPNLPPENGRNKKTFFEEKIYPSGYPNQAKSRPYLLSIFNEKYNYFLLYLAFFGLQMGPGSKLTRSQVRLAPLFQKPLFAGQLLVKKFWSQLI